MRLAGQLCLLATFVSTGYAAFACILGWRTNQRLMLRSGLAAGIGSLVAISISIAVLSYGLLAKDFRFAYVAQHANRQLPWHYAISSLWVGQAGSLLLWTWLSIAVATAFQFMPRRQRSSLCEPAFGAMMGFCCFLASIMVFAADPLTASLAPPEDGAGLSPILQHPAMLIHPPIVFLGYAIWSVPCALAITAIATGELSVSWVREARSSTLFAWAILGSGILLGAYWAYTELGWGGYWAWDPVENGSLIPWLIGTAALHTHMAWRLRGILKKSAIALTISTFGMCNFATFLTRSGIFSSLHAFSQSPIGWLFLAFMLALAVCTTAMLAARRKSLKPERSIGSVWSREAMILASTIAFLGLAIVTCVGSLSTVISDALMGHKVVVGVEFYNNALIPTGLIVLLASGAAPLLRWGGAPTKTQRKALRISILLAGVIVSILLIRGDSRPLWLAVCGLLVFSLTAFLATWCQDARRAAGGRLARFLFPLRNRRRQYAGYVVHLGFFLLALGVTGSALGSRSDEVTLRVGESVHWAGRQVQLVEMGQRELPDKLVAEAFLKIDDGCGGADTLVPAQHFHRLQQEWTTEVSILSTWQRDYYAILHGGEESGQVRLSLIENPMMRFIWLGGIVMGMGTVAAIWPVRRRREIAALEIVSPKQTNRGLRRALARAACVAILASPTAALAEETHDIVTADLAVVRVSSCMR